MKVFPTKDKLKVLWEKIGKQKLARKLFKKNRQWRLALSDTKKLFYFQMSVKLFFSPSDFIEIDPIKAEFQASQGRVYFWFDFSPG